MVFELPFTLVEEHLRTPILLLHKSLSTSSYIYIYIYNTHSWNLIETLFTKKNILVSWPMIKILKEQVNAVSPKSYDIY